MNGRLPNSRNPRGCEEAIRIAVVEMHEDVRETLCGWIRSSAACRCVASCSTGKDALNKLERYVPDIVFISTRLPGESGITCAWTLKKRFPSLHVIIYSDQKDPGVVFQALRAGVSGYLVQPSSCEEVLQSIDDVRSGGAPLSREIASKILQFFHPARELPNDRVAVSRRETEVLELLSSGMSNKQIASELGISYETVCVHLRRIYPKLGVRTRTEAVIKHLQSRRDLLVEISPDSAPLRGSALE